jgi:hypothetical protein
MEVSARGILAIALRVALLLPAACSASSGSSSPNKTPGQCVLSNGVWYCGDGYGNFANCPSSVPYDVLTDPKTACTNGDWDGGGCFYCSEPMRGSGTTCECEPGDAGLPVPQCVPTGTGCGPSQ